MARMKRRDLAWFATMAATMVVMCWMFGSAIVFAVRHPWMTENHQFFHLLDVLTFSKVEKGCHE